MISTTAEYALRAVVMLAGLEEQPVTVNVIAERSKVPKNYLSKVLQALSRARLVVSKRGPGGGHLLSKPPQAITVLDVVNSIDPLQRITTCPLGLEAHGTNLCPLHRKIDDAYASIERAFHETTIGDLIESPKGYKQFYELSKPMIGSG